MTRDLGAIRAQLAERRARTAAVDSCFHAADQAWESRAREGWQLDKVTLRCDHGDRTLLAQLYVLPEGLLFSSKIAWRPPDKLQLPVWQRDAFLTDPQLAEWSDRQLLDWLDTLDTWSRGVPPDGPRWLSKAGETYVRDVLDLPTGQSGWLPNLWVRYAKHPQHAEAVDRGTIATAARRATRTTSAR